MSATEGRAARYLGVDAAEAGCAIALGDLRNVIRESLEAARDAVRVVDAIDGLPALFRELASVADGMAAHIARCPKPLRESLPEEQAEWSALCTRKYQAEEKLIALAREYVARATTEAY